MKIALMGATGNVGSHTLRQAVSAGHEVVAYARRPEAVEKLPGVAVAAGGAEDGNALTEAIRGCDALIVTVTGPMKDTSFAQRTVPVAVKAAEDAGVRRLVLVSAFGAGETADKAGGFAKLVYRSVLKGFFGDKAASESSVTSSVLDWTIVYPVNLNGKAAHQDWAAVSLSEVAKVPGLPSLPFDNVASTLVNLVDDPSSYGDRILVTSSKGWKPAAAHPA